MNSKRALGRGLNALISDTEEVINETKDTTELDISLIEPNRDQPRKLFDEQALVELSESIKEFGIIQPLIVRKIEDYYEIIAGERRWRAARLAGIKKIPVIIKNYDNLHSIQVSLIENLQREDLNPLEEALSFKRLAEEFDLKQEEIAEKVGKSRSAVTNTLRILNLDDRVQKLIYENKISAGHARALLVISDSDLQYMAAEKIVFEELSVRQVELLVKEITEKEKEKLNEVKPKNNVSFFNSNIYYKTMEKQLNTILGTKVKIQNGKNKGKIEIEYYTDDDLENIVSMIKKLEVSND